MRPFYLQGEGDLSQGVWVRGGELLHRAVGCTVPREKF